MARTYAEKRNAALTPEPEFVPREPTDAPLRFVVQRHEASRLHFDFRLECDGALKSWAVPKGPSLDPSVKRMAIMVEDHPIEYADFEGRISKGQYGGGEVIIWDEGAYAPEGETGSRRQDESTVRAGLRAGELKFTLHGQRLRGGFVLVRMRQEESWLLIKHRDEYATDADPTKMTDSVRTHLTAEDLRTGAVAGKGAPTNDAVQHVPEQVAYGLMVPGERATPFRSEQWTFEPKVDGVRALAIKHGAGVRLITRNGNDIADRFPGVVDSVRALSESSIVLDGELVLIGDDGKPSFEALMDAYQGNRASGPVRYYLFDLLSENGEDVRGLPLSERRRRLERVPLTATVQLLPSFPTEGEVVFEQALEMGFEGVVAKRLASPYRAGVSGDWLKVKGYHSEEFLIGGYTEGQGARAGTFGALLLGRPEKGGGLQYCGNVGTGFSDQSLDEFRKQLDAARASVSPFGGDVDVAGKVAFVRPELLAEVKFVGWTKGGKLRHPVFLRLRPDRKGADVMSGVREPMEMGNSKLLEELTGSKEDELTLDLNGHPVALTHLNKEIWPGSTKRELIRYLLGIGEVFIEYLRDRPLTFVRYPDGIGGESFFQRHWEKGLPDFVETVEIFSKSNRGARRSILCNNLATLVWLGQISAVELHPWHSRCGGDNELPTDFSSAQSVRVSALSYPDYLACDLDPNIRAAGEDPTKDPAPSEIGWQKTVDVAFALKELLDALSMDAFVKTTGKTGLHVFVPLERRYSWEQVEAAARTLGEHLMAKMPDQITMEFRLKKRPARVFFDSNMNGFGRTLAGAYSPRPINDAWVSMPLTWDQLAKAWPGDFTLATVPALVAERGDAWAGMREHRGRLPN